MRQLRNIECYLSDANLRDAVSGLLYTLNIVRDNEIIVSLTVGNSDAEGIRPISFTCIEEKETMLVVHK